MPQLLPVLCNIQYAVKMTRWSDQR